MNYNTPFSKDIICIVCPNGCKLHAEMLSDGQLVVTGNKCVRGKHFAGTEISAPTRSLTTTIKTAFKDMPFLPVRTNGEIPKGKINTAIEELSQFILTNKVLCGDIIIENLANTGCSVIATLDSE